MYMVWCLFGVGRLIDGVSGNVKFLIEVLVNGGCNYNGFKVVKFFVG